MRSVMISIRPEWCAKILNGEKTVEIRKTRPKLKTPFKCNIYCTKSLKSQHILEYTGRYDAEIAYACGRMIAEFICDKIMNIDCDSVAPFNKSTKEYIDKESCVDRRSLWKYTNGLCALGWHISKLKIYDKPKELADFIKVCKYREENDGFGCNCSGRGIVDCEYQAFDYNPDGSVNCVACNGGFGLKKPPQSWCYVEELA